MRKNILLAIAGTALLLSCASQPKNTETATNTEQKTNTAPDIPQDIGINSIIAEGTIIIENDEYSFKVKKVIKRGRDAPIVLSKQILKLKENESIKTLQDENITTTLTCSSPMQSNSLWSIDIK